MNMDIKSAFENYASLNFGFADLTSRLGSAFAVEASDCCFEFCICKEPFPHNDNNLVVLTNGMIQKALENMLERNIEDKEIRYWAHILIMADHYDSCLDDVEIEILHDLATFGESKITPNAIKNYLQCIATRSMPGK